VSSDFTIIDGQAAWYAGPEWNHVALAAAQAFAPGVEDRARSNAIWEDRTGDARAGLTAEASESQGIIYLELAHTVDYGQWLEVIQNGRFAVIMRTLEEEAPPVFDAIALAVANARHGHNY
jgi:hypothetical protein